MNNSSQGDGLPLSFHVSIPKILAKSLATVAVLFLLSYIAIRSNSNTVRLIVGVVFLLIAPLHLDKLVALTRLNDSIIITQNGIFSNTIWGKKYIQYEDISCINIESSLLNGIQYRIITTSGDSIVFTSAIENHLLLYNRIARTLPT
jgi:hypothetical protein